MAGVELVLNAEVREVLTELSQPDRDEKRPAKKKAPKATRRKSQKKKTRRKKAAKSNRKKAA